MQARGCRPPNDWMVTTIRSLLCLRAFYSAIALLLILALCTTLSQPSPCFLFPLPLFSPDGWSTTIKDVSCDFVDRDKSGTFMVGFAAIVRVTTKNGKIVMHGVHGGVFL